MDTPVLGSLLEGRGSGVPLIPLERSDNFRPVSKKVLIITPTYKSFSPMTALCIAQLADRRRTALMQNHGDAFVAHMRNSCAAEFLKTDYEYALWVDDDIIVPCGRPKWFKMHCGWSKFPDEFAKLNTIDRLLSHGKTLVGALYFGRHTNASAIFAEGMKVGGSGYDLARACPRDEIRPTAWVGFGCVLTHRSVFEGITKRFPALKDNWFSSSEHHLMDDVDKTREMLSNGPMTGEKAFRAFEMLEAASKRARTISGLGAGEDVMLCRRARESGHECFVDLGLVCGHVGHRVYPDNLWH